MQSKRRVVCGASEKGRTEKKNQCREVGQEKRKKDTETENDNNSKSFHTAARAGAAPLRLLRRADSSAAAAAAAVEAEAEAEEVSLCFVPTAAAIYMAEGNESLDDCDMLT